MKNRYHITHAKLSIYISGVFFLLCAISSCNFNADKKQKTGEDTNTQLLTGTEPFTPSHTSFVELTTREDGDFDTSSEISYRDPNGKIWVAPAGTITDGASIPPLFESFFGGKLNKDFLFAAIVHDAYCAIANEGGSSYQTETWQNTHHMFYNACIQNGTDIPTAGTMYAAVRLGGPRWSFHGAPFTDLSEEVEDSILITEMKKCKDWIESKGDTLKLEHIDQWMDDRENILLKGR